MENNKKSPLITITKKGMISLQKEWGIRFIAILAAMLVSALVTTILTGDNPIQVYATMCKGAFGSNRKIWILLQETAMLLCVALALTPAFRMKFWNLGGEGQVLIGGLAAASCMILLGDKMPNTALILVMTVASIAAGAFWAGIPALCKAKWGTNETLFTLMMNYVATQIVAFFVIVWEVPKGSGKIGIINQNSMAGWFPQIGDAKYLLNILLVAVLTIIMQIYMKYSKHGYEIMVVGESEATAR